WFRFYGDSCAWPLHTCLIGWVMVYGVGLGYWATTVFLQEFFHGEIASITLKRSIIGNSILSEDVSFLFMYIIL
ncbi:hypothetical protein ACJX0J_019602, partial [Zea mays]